MHQLTNYDGFTVQVIAIICCMYCKAVRLV